MSVRILTGDCREVLRTLPDASVHCVVTSPPYFGLRDYGTAQWEGGDADCDHRESSPARTAASVAASGLEGGKANVHRSHEFRGDCLRCGARRVDSQIGLEPTPDAYVSELVAVFRECRRVLRDDGTCWLNLGDSYAQNEIRHRQGDSGSTLRNGNCKADEPWAAGTAQTGRRLDHRCKPKDLIGIPWLVAFALRADGWWLRGDNVWGKPNGMPESTRDRPTRSHEYVFLLTKSERYWYDCEAVKTAPKASTATQLAKDYTGQSTKGHDAAGVQNASDVKRRIVEKMRRSDKQRGHTRRHAGFNDRWDEMERLEQMAQPANLRSVWWVPPAQYREAHFAVMPALVAEICILAGCPAGGTVLDPFGGSGTTGMVADRLQRNAILVELNPAYAEMARKRVHGDAPLFAEVAA